MLTQIRQLIPDSGVVFGRFDNMEAAPLASALPPGLESEEWLAE